MREMAEMRVKLKIERTRKEGRSRQKLNKCGSKTGEKNFSREVKQLFR